MLNRLMHVPLLVVESLILPGGDEHSSRKVAESILKETESRQLDTLRKGARRKLVMLLCSLTISFTCRNNRQKEATKSLQQCHHR